METDEKGRVLTALQLVGSPTSQFYFELSLLYARPVVCPPGFRLLFLVAYPSGTWSLGTTPDAKERFSLAEILDRLTGIDLVVPHLFCPVGLTTYRSFFEDVLGLPLVGSPGKTLQIAQRKHLTLRVATDCGLRTAQRALVRVGEEARAVALAAELGYPLVVKPDEADNSDGLSLVQSAAELPTAVERAAACGERILLEAYVPGREIRGAVVELAGELRVLPFIEYQVSAEHPIRLAEDKLRTDASGSVTGQSRKENIPAVCPAKLTEELVAELGDMMRKMHRELGCRDFSLYDFRVHAETGQPYLLEAGLFWSFGALSMISSMLRAADLDLPEVTEELWRKVARS